MLSDQDHHVARMYDNYMEQHGFNRRTVYIIARKASCATSTWPSRPAASEDYDTLRVELEKLK